ncbi:MAG: AraC family transcriptional regulator [Paenibacillus sp.]|nr:AraC family transcriptional regulator [Paenibacillus sp.]
MKGSDLQTKLSFHIYFKHKEKFDFFEETYTEWTVFAVEQGSFHYNLDGVTGTATFGDLLVCKPGVAVQRVVIAPLSLHFLRVSWEHGGETVGDSSGIIPEGKISIGNKDRLSYNYAELRKTNPLPKKPVTWRQNHFFQDIWSLYCQETEKATMQENVQARPKNMLMKKAAAAIQQRAYEPFNLKTVADELELTSYTFSRQFKAAYGETPMQYLNALRLNKAKMLLTETNMTLAQISECCGYQSGFYLNKLFMKQLHITPAQFRHMHRV